MRGSISDRYINRISATIVALGKILEGAMAGYLLFQILRIFGPIFQQIVKGTLTIAQFLELVSERFSVETAQLDDLLNRIRADEAAAAAAFPWIVFLCLLALVVAALILVVIETIALLTLRFARSGASTVKVIHQIYLIVSFLHLCLFVYVCFIYYRNIPDLNQWIDPTVNISQSAIIIASVVIGVIYFIILMMHLCYHKDIAMAMTTVKYEIETGEAGNLRRTHLSGISFFFALGYVLAFVSWVSEQHVHIDFNSGAILFLAAYAIIILKQFAICFCNRNLKRARYPHWNG